MNGEYTATEQTQAMNLERSLEIIGISCGNDVSETLLDVVRKNPAEARRDVGTASQVARFVAQLDSLTNGPASGYRVDGSALGKVNLENSTASVTFCNILKNDKCLDSLNNYVEHAASWGAGLNFEKELVGFLKGGYDSVLAYAAKVMPNDTLLRNEAKANLQNMYMDAKLLQACGREGDILSLMNEVKDRHDVHNIELGTEPKLQDRFNEEFERKVPMYKEAAEKLKAAGKEITMDNLQLCVVSIQRAKESKEAEQNNPKPEEDKSKGFWNKLKNRIMGKAKQSTASKQEQPETPDKIKPINRVPIAIRMKLQGRTEKPKAPVVKTEANEVVKRAMLDKRVKQ